MDAHKCADKFENSSLSQWSAEEGSATASVHVTAAASEQASTSQTAFVTANIELSKSHWSECVKIDCHAPDDEIAQDNLRVFDSLQKHSQWGPFFRTFGYDTDIRRRYGEMEVGEKFAEGGQAELFHARITWRDSGYNQYCETEKVEWVLKVFKKGTRLRELQSQWPQGYLKWWANDNERSRLGHPGILKWRCDVMFGALMRDGRFAFVMAKESGDLRAEIDKRMLSCGNDTGPFPTMEVEEIMYQIARGVDWLHNNNIVHRDIKASNALFTNDLVYIADFECSVGVVGTGFWRAPEILQACKDRTVNQRPELFSKASDAYSFGMTFYEVLTGKYPFQDEGATTSAVIEGKQPHIPGFVDAEHKDLLRWCWRLDPASRPTFDEILTFLEARSESIMIVRMRLERVKVHKGGPALVGCMDPSHSLSRLECATNGSYVCKLCLEEGTGEVYHCSSCGDFELHPQCAIAPRKLVSFLHPHELEVLGPYDDFGGRICNGCYEDLTGFEWAYRCKSGECDFDLHARCGKYAASISHACHGQHKLLLAFILGASGLDDDSITKCESCKMGIRRKAFVYRCEECNFNIHPSCALGKLGG